MSDKLQFVAETRQLSLGHYERSLGQNELLLQNDTLLLRDDKLKLVGPLKLLDFGRWTSDFGQNDGYAR